MADEYPGSPLSATSMPCPLHELTHMHLYKEGTSPSGTKILLRPNTHHVEWAHNSPGLSFSLHIKGSIQRCNIFKQKDYKLA